MNEFIFWDKSEKKFYDNVNTFYDNNEQYRCALADGKVLVHHYYNEYEEDLINPYKEDNVIVPFQYIGLNDIDNNKIFADSSIVEFDFLGFGELTPDNYAAFIKWNREKFRYDIQTLSRIDKDGDFYVFDMGKCIDRISNIKIIDTIQENKLNLIKE